jgi:hypothetical protein
VFHFTMVLAITHGSDQCSVNQMFPIACLNDSAL